MVAFWKKIKFWKKPKKIEYRFQQSPWDDATWVEITSGDYAGVIFSYGLVKLNQDSYLPQLSFDYSVLASGKHTIDSLTGNEDFVTIMGDILTEIIIENESIRTNNTEESDLQ